MGKSYVWSAMVNEISCNKTFKSYFRESEVANFERKLCFLLFNVLSLLMGSMDFYYYWTFGKVSIHVWLCHSSLISFLTWFRNTWQKVKPFCCFFLKMRIIRAFLQSNWMHRIIQYVQYNVQLFRCHWQAHILCTDKTIFCLVLEGLHWQKAPNHFLS